MQTMLRTWGRSGAARLLAASLLGYAIQVIEECWVRDAGTIGVANDRRALRRKSGHGKSHGDAMVTVRLDFRTAQLARLAAFNAQSIGALFHRRAHATQIFR